MSGIFRLMLSLFAAGAIIGIIAWVVSGLKKRRRFRIVAAVVIIAIIVEFVFLCDRPMSPKVNEKTIEQGVSEIIENVPVKEEPTVFVKDNIEYHIYVYSHKSEQEAMDIFEECIDDRFHDEIKVCNKTRYSLSDCFRPRDWRYFGVSSGSFGDIYAVKDTYVVEVTYYYETTTLEEYIGIIVPPTTFYRETVDLVGLK